MKIDLLLPSGRYILVKAPDAAKGFFINKIGCLRCTIMHGHLEEGHVIQHTIDDDLSDYKVIGPVSSMTEEQWKDIVLYYGNGIGYKNYEPPSNLLDAFETAKESGLSWLKANRIYTENPCPHPSDIEPTNRAHYDNIEAKWREAQERTGNFILLKRI